MIRTDEVRHHLVEILTKPCVMEGLTADELGLVCWACGISTAELMPHQIEFISGNPAPVSPVFS